MLSTVSACVQIFIMKKKKTDCSPSIGFKFLLLKLIFAYVQVLGTIKRRVANSLFDQNPDKQSSLFHLLLCQR